MTDHCATCDAWRRGYRSGDAPHDWVTKVNGDDDFGACRDAPAVHVGDGSFTQPIMHNADWCRRYAPIAGGLP
jgi:hypothetical protein